MKINIEVDIPQKLADAGAVELFSKNFGWTEKIQDIETNTEIDNPISAFDFGVTQIKNYLLQHAKRQYKSEQDSLVEATFTSLISE